MHTKIKDFLTESAANIITLDNYADHNTEIIVAIAGDENLKKGYEFLKNNISEYGDDDFVTNMIDGFLVNLNKKLTEKPRLVNKVKKAEDKGYSGNKWVGRHYEDTKDLPISKISKLIKAELNIEFPDWSFSVRTSSHRSISVHIEDVPYNPYSEDFQELLKQGKAQFTWEEQRYDRKEKYSEQFKDAEKKMNKIISQYNFDDSDSSVDYFSTHYYDNFTVNDVALIAKFYPEHEENNKSIARSAEWDERSKKANEEAKKIREQFPYKKGESVLYHVTGVRWLPDGDYSAKILTAPNGRGKFTSKYQIRVYYTKVIRNGVTIDNKGFFDTFVWDSNVAKLLKPTNNTIAERKINEVNSVEDYQHVAESILDEVAVFGWCGAGNIVGNPPMAKLEVTDEVGKQWCIWAGFNGTWYYVKVLADGDATPHNVEFGKDFRKMIDYIKSFYKL